MGPHHYAKREKTLGGFDISVQRGGKGRAENIIAYHTVNNDRALSFKPIVLFSHYGEICIGGYFVFEVVRKSYKTSL